MENDEKSDILADLGLSLDKKVIKLRELDPNCTAAEISRDLGFSREYIRQILRRNGLETNITNRKTG